MKQHERGKKHKRQLQEQKKMERAMSTRKGLKIVPVK
jgi:hypothetical protein